MAGTGVIEDFVSAKAFQQLEQVETYLSALNITLVEGIKNAKAYSDALAGARGLKEIQTTAAKAAQELEKLNRLEAQTAIAQKNLAKATAQADAAQIKLNQTQQQATAQAAKLTAATERQAQAAIKASGDYQRLSRELTIAREKAKDLYLQFGPNSEEFLRAQDGVNKLDKKIKAIDGSLGQYQRNVGNYARNISVVGEATGNTFGKLGNVLGKAFGVIRTAAYILPGLGIAGIFGLIIDGITKVVKSLDLFETAASRAKLAQQTFNNALASSEYSGAIQSLEELRINIDLANKGFADKDAVIEQYNESIGKVAGRVDTLDEAERGLVKNGPSFLRITLLKAAAQLALADAAKKTYEAQQIANKSLEDFGDTGQNLAAQQNKGNILSTLFPVIFDDENEQIKQQDTIRAQRRQRVVSDTTAQATKLIGIATKFQTDAAKIAKENNFANIFGGEGVSKVKQLENDIANIKLEAQLTTNREIIDNDKLSYGKRISASRSFATISQQISKNNYNLALTDTKLSNNEKLKAQLEYQSKVEESNVELNKRIRDLVTSQSRDSVNVIKNRLERQKANEEQIISNTLSSYDDRLSAISRYEKVSRELIKLSAAEQIKDAGENRLKITAIKEQEQADLLKVQTDGNKKRTAIEKDAQAELKVLFTDGVKNANTALQQEIIDLRDAQDTKLLEIEQYQAEALNATADLYRDGKISVAQYNQQVYDIEKQAATDRINLQIETLEKILATQKENLSFGIGDPKDVQKTQNLITKLRIDASNLETKTILDNVNKVKEARKSLHDLEKQIADQSIELIQTLVDGSYQRQLDALSAQSDQLTANADKEKEVVDRSLATDEEKANKKRIIDAKTQSQQEVIAAKEREVKTRQAKFDKAISIAKIIEAVGIAEVNALAYLSNPFTAPLYPAIAAAIGALGALQLATVIATPIPKYAKGTDYHKGGAMIVGDAGTELVIEPNGKRYLTPDTDTLTTAPKGTRVLPNHEVIKMLAKPERINYVGGQSVDIMQLVREQRKTTKAIQGQKMAGTLITKGGWKRQQQQVSNWNAYRNNHFN